MLGRLLLCRLTACTKYVAKFSHTISRSARTLLFALASISSAVSALSSASERSASSPEWSEEEAEEEGEGVGHLLGVGGRRRSERGGETTDEEDNGEDIGPAPGVTAFLRAYKRVCTTNLTSPLLSSSNLQHAAPPTTHTAVNNSSACSKR